MWKVTHFFSPGHQNLPPLYSNQGLGVFVCFVFAIQHASIYKCVCAGIDL